MQAITYDIPDGWWLAADDQISQMIFQCKYLLDFLPKSIPFSSQSNRKSWDRQRDIFKLAKQKVDLTRRWHHIHWWSILSGRYTQKIHWVLYISWMNREVRLIPSAFLKLSKNLAHILSNLNYYRNRQAMRPIIKRKRWSYKPPKNPSLTQSRWSNCSY